MTAIKKQKRGLGRGLDALFQDEETAHYKETPSVAAPVETKGQRKLFVTDLIAGKFQPRRRFVQDALEQLADSIKIHGILQPLLVRPISNGKYEIIAGERRWRAAQQAQLHEVPVVIQELTDEEALEIGLIENLQRKDLTPMEEAEGYRRLINEFSYKQEKLAKQLGKSRSQVTNTLRLLKLPKIVQDLVQDEELSAGHARALITAENAEELAKIVIKKGLSVRETEKMVTKNTQIAEKQQKTPRNNGKDVDTLALEAELTRNIGLNVIINAKENNEGDVIISYKDLDQLDALIKRLSW